MPISARFAAALDRALGGRPMWELAEHAKEVARVDRRDGTLTALRLVERTSSAKRTAQIFSSGTSFAAVRK